MSRCCYPKLKCTFADVCGVGGEGGEEPDRVPVTWWMKMVTSTSFFFFTESSESF